MFSSLNWEYWRTRCRKYTLNTAFDGVSRGELQSQLCAFIETGTDQGQPWVMSSNKV